MKRLTGNDQSFALLYAAISLVGNDRLGFHGFHLRVDKDRFVCAICARRGPAERR